MIKKKVANALLDIIQIWWVCCLFGIPLIIIHFVNPEIGMMILVSSVVYFCISGFILIKCERLGSGVGAQC
jgi:hypothetical protein